MRRILTVLGAGMALSGCASLGEAGDTLAVGEVRSSAGQSLGSARIVGQEGGRALMLDLNGVPPGAHGVHLHSTGRCDGPDFTSAGPHWNPTNAQHGALNPAGPHAGDLGNAVADGSGRLRATLPLPRSAAGQALFDADGAAVIVHSGRDDERTDPGGDSGDRIACGVLRPE